MTPTVFINTAAALLNVSRRTVYNYIKTGRLSTVRTAGGSQRVTTESLVRVAADLTSAGHAGTRPLLTAADLSRAEIASRHDSRH